MSDKKYEKYHQKFKVERTDGNPKHDGCEYLVLDLTHDKGARAAALYYSEYSRKERARFCAELAARVYKIMDDQEESS